MTALVKAKPLPWWGNPDPDLAYEVDRWTRYAWDWYLRRSEPLPEDWDETIPDYSKFVREVFGRLYDELIELDDPEQWAAFAHARADEVPEFEQLRLAVATDRWDAGESARAIGEHVLENWPKQPSGAPWGQPQKGDGEGEDAGGEGKDDEDDGDEDQDDGSDEAARKLRQAFRQACGQAMEEHVERQAATAMLGWSKDGTGCGRDQNPEAKARLAKVLKKHRRIVELARHVGRMRRLLRRARRETVRSLPHEIAEVGPGADLARTLPSELALLRHRTTRLEFMRRYIERTTLTYQLQGTEQKGRGPMVVCVDTSGSMQGAPDTWAKALAIALVQQAMEDGRHAAVLTFDSYLRATYEFNPKQGLTIDQLAQLLDDFSGGGTSFQAPLNQARALIDQPGEWERADVVLVTDGECGVDDDWLEDWNGWREENGVKAFALLVGRAIRYWQEDLVDEVVKIEDLAQDDKGLARLLAGVA